MPAAAADRPSETAGGPAARAEAAAPSFDQIIQYTLFHKSATASPVQPPGQSGPVVTGRLNAGTDNGAPLVFSVAQNPAGGTVEVRPDGSYVYTAGAVLAQSGGTDSFRVSIDNGGPFRLSGIGGAIQGIISALAQAFGLRQPDSITVTVPVTVTIARHPDDDGTLSVADLDALARANEVGATVNDGGLITALVGGFTGQKVRNAEEAAEALDRVAGLLGAPGDFVGDIAVQTTDFGAGGASQAFYRLTQKVNGVPVLGSEVVLSAMQDGTATGVFSGIDPRIYEVNTTPDAAIDNAAEVIAAATRILLTRFSNPPAGLAESLTFDNELVIYALDPAVEPALTWLVNVSTTDPTADTDLPLVSTTYYIHANGTNTGQLLAEDSGFAGLIDVGGENRTGSEYGLNDVVHTINYVDLGQTNAMIDKERGIIVSVLPQGQTVQKIALGDIGGLGAIVEAPDRLFGVYAWESNPAAVSAMGNTARAYDFFTALGVALPSEIVVGLMEPPGGLPIACFVPLGAGIGLLGIEGGVESALDVIGHEMGHAAVNFVVGEGGFTGDEGAALEEAFADVMGSLIENKQKSDDGRWGLGEDATFLQGQNAVYRNMKYIEALNGSSPVYVKSQEFAYAVYTMMTDARTAEISDEAWAQVFYSSIKRLPKNATFDLARAAVISAAWDHLMAEIEATGDEASRDALFGVFGSKMKAIADAFNAAGIRAEDPRVKIVLRWGENPRDLDAHLIVPASVTGTVPFDLFSGAPQFWESGAVRPSVVLDTDDRTSYGPESITINKLAPGDYYFSVYDYSNVQSTDSTALSRSKAYVEVFTPDVQEIEPEGFGYLFRYLTGNIPTTFEVDGSSAGTRWDVFTLTIPAGAPEGAVPVPVITPINTYSYLTTANRPPVMVSYAISNEIVNGVVTGSVNATDPNGDSLTYSVTDDVDYGRVGLNDRDGSFIYYPDRSARESNSPTYEVSTAVGFLDAPTRVVFGQGGRAYAIGAGSVSYFNPATGTVLSTPTGPFTVELAEANPAGTQAYFTVRGQNLVGTFTPGAGTFAPFKDFGDRFPTAIGFSPGGNDVYVAAVAPGHYGSLSVLDAASGEERRVVSFDGSASGMAVSPDGSKIYLPGNDPSGSGVLRVIDTANDWAVSTITGLDSPNDVVITPDGKRLFLTTNSGSGGSVWVYSTQTNTVIAKTVLTPGLAGYLATSPDGGRVYASVWDPGQGKSSVMVLTASGSVVKAIDFDANAMLFPAPLPDGSGVYVPDKDSTIWKINTVAGDLTDTFVVSVSDGRGGTDSILITVPITPLS